MFGGEEPGLLAVSVMVAPAARDAGGPLVIVEPLMPQEAAIPVIGPAPVFWIVTELVLPLAPAITVNVPGGFTTRLTV